MMPNCIKPARANFKASLRLMCLNLMKGRKTRNEMAMRTKETKLESTPVRLPLISPNEKAQASETKKSSSMITSLTLID
jgi:hypothetical protein